MALDFMAIDFETANGEQGSVCAVGVAQVRGGVIASAESWLIRPPTGDRFTNTHIHGIRFDDVHDAPTWAASLERIDRAAAGRSLVAYNSRFDEGVYLAASRLAGVAASRHDWRDAYALARSRLRLSSYRLPAVVEHLGLDAFAHHEAGADAVACAQLTIALAERERADSVEALWAGAGTPAGPAYSSGRGTAAARRGAAYASRGSTSTRLPKPNPDADPGHVLFGVSITFTGDLETLSRPDAQAMAAEVGAHVTGTPTKKTQVVVVGGFDPTTFKPGATVSSKVQKALDLKAAGQFIEFLSEAQFVEAVNFRGGRG